MTANVFGDGQPAYILPPIKQLGQGPSGVGYYPGIGLPERYDNHFFYCDYKGNGGIFTFSVKPKGAGFEYVEDKDADVDLNLVMTGAGKFIEVQGTGEGATFDQKELDRLLQLGKQGLHP